MINNYRNQVGGPQPMNSQDYNAALEREIQQDTLKHPEKILDQRLFMERAFYKKSLETDACAVKQRMQNRSVKFFYQNSKTWVQVVNGTNMLLVQHVVFNCQFVQVIRYEREGLDEVFWQIVLIDGKSGERIYSPLQNEEILKSCSKLKQTILAKYYNEEDSKVSTLSWRWVRGELMRMLDSSEIIMLPSKAGWFESEEKWKFWVANNTNALLLNELIRRFYTDEFSDISAENVIVNLLNVTDVTGYREHMGALLILRLCAIFARLTDDIPFEMGVAIVGKKSLEVAKVFLRTMHNDVDIVNLDADRLGKIQKQVELLQDTPMIFVSSDPDSKSTQNRLQRVMSWLRSGYIEGTVVDIPFVFCLQRFSKSYPLENMILLEADRILIHEESAAVFSKLQSYVIERVETAGSYYVNEVRRMYEGEKLESEDENKFLSLIRAVVDVVLEMFDQEISEESYDELEKLLYSGEDNIVAQFTEEGHILVEVFQKKMEDLAGLGTVYFADRNEIPFNTGDNVVYYDNEYYYFTSEVLNLICQQTDIDYKTLLLIKQQLAEQDLIKLYKNRSGCSRDLGIDFLVYDSNGERKRLSGLAIKRQFWDKIGGITLAERSGYDGITL